MEHTLKNSCLVNWPVLDYKSNVDTFTLLHMACQMIGKVKLALASKANHWWHITLHLTPTGFTTGLLHYHQLSFEIRMDLLDHVVVIESSDGEKADIQLRTLSVSDFYKELFQKLNNLGIHLKIWGVPVEVEERIPFEKDNKVREYNKETAENFSWVLTDTEKIMEEVKSGFIGKASPVHFFWGTFDLSFAFFSGKKAPDHPGAPNVGRSVVLEAYSHELCSIGFWPGNGFGEPSFFSFVYPEPKGFNDYNIQPSEAYFNKQLSEFILPYSKVEKSGSDEMVRKFFVSSLNAAFSLADWDKSLLR